MKLPISAIKEDFLHYIWKTKKIPTQLTTIDGQQLEIIDFGIYNEDAGPDFFNGKIKYKDTVWAGNIEMHVFTSDWNKHGHQYDKAYENVILHVVYENDVNDLTTLSHKSFPTLELKGKIPKSYLDIYLQLVQSKYEIPCRNLIENVDRSKIDLWKYSLSIERLDQKSTIVKDKLLKSKGDWEMTLYIMVARYFGSLVNIQPFEMMAESLPLHIIFKNKNSKETLDALIFGQAGMLEANYTDEYFLKIKKEYTFQRKKYGIHPIDGVAWKFSKLRPMNFPTVRLAQFSSLMYRVSFLFSQIKEAESIDEMKQMFYAAPSEFWNNHYKFGTESNNMSKQISDEFIDLLLINAVSPVLYTYGIVNNDQKYIDKAILLLENVKGEVNSITKLWKSLKINTKTAFDTQSLIHLTKNYCYEHKCLSCKIGHEIMRK